MVRLLASPTLGSPLSCAEVCSSSRPLRAIWGVAVFEFNKSVYHEHLCISLYIELYFFFLLDNCPEVGLSDYAVGIQFIIEDEMRLRLASFFD